MYKDDINETNIFIPDLSVICDETGLEENKFVGVPEIIMEILSPSNQSHELIPKMDAYMRYGVKEYWIVNPLLNAIQVHTLTAECVYQQADVLRAEGMMKSKVLKGFQVDLEDIFR
ncbi:hypothetical protein JNUCC1_02757 [Lentibacillus sp. JNUCC-1]|nr:hypothetical protein [Lentibacillus sp. JNUCC-1]